ncbi:MAG: hypothetical protein ACE15B_19525 [Bryobacteraceae bacterium]
MKVTLEIDDALMPSIHEYLRTQVVAENNPVSKAQRLRPMYRDAEEWLQQQVGGLVAQVVMQHPTEEVQAQLAQAAAIHDQIRAKAMPRRV